ncbi:aspartate aminotransferase family protein [Hyphomicrobiales bacterium]|nr:aspartate aminotransferase family protein [Hyphomicrobiales bacterium]
MTNLIHRQFNQKLPIAVKGDGPYIYDNFGKKYLDACGGAAVSCLGHNNKLIKKSISQQLESLPYAHSGFFTTDSAEELASMLSFLTPNPLNWVYLVSGGSEAVESGLKIARQYHYDRGYYKKSHIIARKQSYHGNTLGALAAGENIPRKKPYEPILLNSVHHISPCHYWRWGLKGESADDYGLRVANELEDKIIELGADNVSTFIAETIVGATMGAVPAVDNYFKRIRDICNKYDVVMILDEVMCGMGRTGQLYAFEYYSIVPDIVCVAKGLGAGYQPIGAMICNDMIYDSINNSSGYFQHSHTYSAHPVACAAGVSVLKEISKISTLNNIENLGIKLLNKLLEEFRDCPNIGNIRGRGLFIGLEIVSNNITKDSFDPKNKIHARIKKNAFDLGLMVYPMGGTIDGINGDHVLLAPPYIINDNHIDEIAKKLKLSITKAVLEIK